MNLGILYAVIAAIIWGITYTVAEKFLEKISIPTYYVLQYIVGLSILFWFAKDSFISDVSGIVKDKSIFILIPLMALATFGGWCISKSIKETNATVTGMVEITYPLFIMVFSYLFYGVKHFTMPILIGFVFVLVGIIIIFKFK